jgi:hypothetical protein
MADDQIRYDILAQEALRGVMRKVLSEVARTGLPGNHHFFITFVTGAPGVRISGRLREKYPEQMTIVLQYQYWDLKVTDTEFEVGLFFSEVPEKLTIPFTAVRGFYDPSVNFELEFDVANAADSLPEDGSADHEVTALLQESKKPQRKPAKSAKKSKEPKEEPDEEKEEKSSKGAEVVSLDAFRKK